MQSNDPGATAGRFSPDGMWWWDGSSWVPAARPTAPGAAPTAGSQRSWLATWGGITGILAMVTLIVACAIPYVTYTDTTSGTQSTSSVFDGGYAGAWGNVVEPAIVIAFSLAAAIVVIAWANRTARAFGSAALVTMGAQTFGMFAGYDTSGAANGQLEAGGYIGLLAGILLFAGGGLAAGSLLSSQPREALLS